MNEIAPWILATMTAVGVVLRLVEFPQKSPKFNAGADGIGLLLLLFVFCVVAVRAILHPAFAWLLS